MSKKSNPQVPEQFQRDIYPSFLLRPQVHGKGVECFCSPITTTVGSVTIYQHRNPSEASTEAKKGAPSGKNS